MARRSIVAIAILIVGLACGERGLAQTTTERREAAVLKARAGHAAEAQAELRAMLAAGADDGLVAMDLATLLQRDRKPREAVAVFEKAAPATPPDYALLAVARAYRDLHRYKDAERLARQGMERFPTQTVWLLLLSLVLSDARRPREALRILHQAAPEHAPPVERLLAEAYAWRRAGDPDAARRAYSKVLKANADARAEATQALREIRMAPTTARAASTGPPAAPGRAAETALARVEGLLAALPPPPAQADARRRLQREAAILKARAGRTAEAQAELRALLSAGAANPLAAMDLTVLLQQDQKPEEAVAVFEKAAVPEPPDYALLAAARAYRDLHRYADAARLARQGMERFPARPVWPLLLSLVLSDAGRTAEALDILSGSAAQHAAPVERLLAEAYAWRRAGDPYKALALYTEAVKLAPAAREARLEAAAVLREQSAPYGAAGVAGNASPFAADQAAAMVRWGAQVRSSDPAHRFDGTDAALARLDALLAELPPASAEDAIRRRLRLDRMVALRDRARMQEAVAEGDALRAEGALPQYAEEAYADALLYLRRPRDAREAYERVLAQSPKDVAARYGLFYAAVELEDFAAAYAAIDAMVSDEPIWRGYRDDPTRYPNTERVSAEVTAAQARFYGNQLGEAWARITKIADAAPANGAARLALYQIANARGWPRRATEEGEIAASLDPQAVGSKIALIEVAIANYRFADARRMMNDLLVLYPENTAAQRLARDVDAAERWLVELEVKPADSSGGGANASGRSLTSLSKVTTPPIGDNWRLFVSNDYANAHPPEGYVQRSRVSAGVEWRVPNLTATVYPAQSWGTLSKAGGGATVDWLITDQLRLAVAGALYSWETPLRAELHGITADEYSAKATYRWHESRSVTASFAFQPFTDGNRRISAGSTYKERLINLPGFDLTGSAEAYTSRNTRRDAPYYNPRRDLSVTGGVLAEHVLWRRYENSFVQALRADAGLYSEAGFRNNWIATIEYQHRWRFDPLTESHYGVMWSRRVYDGSPEKSLTLIVGLTQRL
jgi:biofilm PGA synthesis protein PgaA